jgi:regulator of protease activity HflC (stomatin/prohibitin superfamily)
VDLALDRIAGWIAGVARWLWDEHKGDLVYALALGFWGVMRLAGKTVQSGQIGLKFSFGRATRECEPGFYPLVPVFQTIRIVPSRSRTIDLPRQKLTTFDGLVYDVDATLVFRVADVRKALIEVDDLSLAMLQMLSLGVHEVLSRLDRSELRVSEGLDARLGTALAQRLEPWGVVVERAGFNAIAPTSETIRITQLAERVRTRGRAFSALEAGGLGRRRALAMLGTSTRFVPRTRRLRRLAIDAAVARGRRAFLDTLEAELSPADRPIPEGAAGMFQRAARREIARRRELGGA